MRCKKWLLAFMLFSFSAIWILISAYLFTQFLGAMFGATASVIVYINDSEHLSNLIGPLWLSYAILIILVNIFAIYWLHTHDAKKSNK